MLLVLFKGMPDYQSSPGFCSNEQRQLKSKHWSLFKPETVWSTGQHCGSVVFIVFFLKYLPRHEFGNYGSRSLPWLLVSCCALPSCVVCLSNIFVFCLYVKLTCLYLCAYVILAVLLWQTLISCVSSVLRPLSAWFPLLYISSVSLSSSSYLPSHCVFSLCVASQWRKSLVSAQCEVSLITNCLPFFSI